VLAVLALMRKRGNLDRPPLALDERLAPSRWGARRTR
jgi:hypothetical protein